MPLKRIKRNPLRFDVFDAFADFRSKRQTSLHEGSTGSDDFFARAREQLDASLNDARLLHGRRTESMFEGLVASLGQVRLLRHEDAGGGWTDGNLTVPDFHLVLLDGSRMLVEVKNYYQRESPFESFTLRSDYLASLQRYAALLNCPLRLAVFWARWGMWTLVPPDIFIGDSGRSSVDLSVAGKANEMVVLGDMMVGTTPPLVFRLMTDEREDRRIDDSGHVEFTVKHVQLFCAGKEITKQLEQSIAMYLMMYGKWEEHENLVIENGDLEAIEWVFTPPQMTDLGFEVVGNLSEMFSRYYLGASTTDEDTVAQTLVPYSPEILGELIPADYSSDTLPLWKFHLRPYRDVSQGTE